MGFNPWNIWGKMNGGDPKAGPGGIAGFTQDMLEETAEAMAARCAASDGGSWQRIHSLLCLSDWFTGKIACACTQRSSRRRLRLREPGLWLDEWSSGRGWAPGQQNCLP